MKYAHPCWWEVDARDRVAQNDSAASGVVVVAADVYLGNCFIFVVHAMVGSAHLLTGFVSHRL